MLAVDDGVFDDDGVTVPDGVSVCEGVCEGVGDGVGVGVAVIDADPVAVSDAFAERVTDAEIVREERKGEGPSDHVPVVVNIR